MDFCHSCEKERGTIALYRRYPSNCTPEIRDAVYKAQRTPEGRRSEEQVRLLVIAAPKLNPKTAAEAAQGELYKRELQRRSLIYYVSSFFPDYKAGWVHQDVCRRLEKFMVGIERGESPRLMLFLPPRTGKSKLASDMFISWFLGHHPEWEVISASYAQQLPIGFSRSIRDRINDPAHQAVFPNTHLRKDSQAADEWHTTAGGGYRAAGVSVGITGFGMHLGVVDDPVKDQSEAQSETVRENTVGWYHSTFRTRLAPGAGILIIMTRWHDADLAGKLLEDEDRLIAAGVPRAELENWEVISYPAIAEHDEWLMKDGAIARGVVDEAQTKRLLRKKGEALHPERYSIEELRRIRNPLPPTIWASLYQQNPAPDDGAFFKRDYFVYRQLDPDYWPQGVVMTTIDYAIAKKTRNDWTVITTGILMPGGELYILNVRRDRWGTLDIVDQLIDSFKTYKTNIFAGEQGQLHAAIWPVLKQRMEAERVYVSLNDSLVPIQDKEARARPMQAMMQLKKVIFSFDPVVNRPQIFDTVEKELLRFPMGAHDDIVDSMAWCCRLAMQTSLPHQSERPRMKSWKDTLKVHVEGRHSWMGT